MIQHLQVAVACGEVGIHDRRVAVDHNDAAAQGEGGRGGKDDWREPREMQGENRDNKSYFERLLGKHHFNPLPAPASEMVERC